MSAVETISGVPSSFEVDTTVRFTDSDSAYPSTEWTSAFVLNNGTDEPVSIAGTAAGSGFSYVIPATTALIPGVYQWAQYFTAISPTTERARGKTGSLNVLPGLANPVLTPSFAQQMVTALEAANLSGASNRRSSVSMNGQSVSWNTPGEFREQWTFWKARVIAEKREAAILRGERPGGPIEVTFLQSRTRYPFA